jgi:anti-anti-sigma factor
MDEQCLKVLDQAVDQNAGSSSGVSMVVLDLACVRFLPSLALGQLVHVSKKCAARQQKLKLAAVQAQIRQVFVVTRLERVFEFADSVDAAIQ